MLKNLLLICVFFLFSGCFGNNDEKLLLKCADIKYEKILGTYSEGGTSTLELLFKDNLKKRFDHSDLYIKFYRNCEYELNSSPKTFKQLYN